MTEEFDPNKEYKAEGAREFTADPSSIFNLPGMTDAFKHVVNEASDKTARRVNQDASDEAQNIDAMKEILMKMHDNAQYSVDKTLRSPEGKDLKHQLITESTKSNDWQIRIDESSNKDEYQIVNKYSSKSFFDSVSLIESAKKICQFLENGYPVNSKVIQEVLYYDDIYRSCYDQCMNCKRLHKSAKASGDHNRMNVLADKFDTLKEKALKAKQKVKKL